jgi:hypothetical protein
LIRISLSSVESALQRPEALADAARLRAVERIERHHAAFGQAVALDERHADGFVELGEIFAQGRGAGRGHANPAAETLADLAEHQRSAKPAARMRSGTGLPCRFDSARRRGQRQSAIEGFARGRGALAKLGADGGVDALPHARRRQKNGGAHFANILRQLHQAFKERHGHAPAEREHLDHHALRDVRRGQERHRGILRAKGQHGRAHIDVGHNGGVRHQRHFGLAGGAGSQIENRGVGGRGMPETSSSTPRVFGSSTNRTLAPQVRMVRIRSLGG